MSPRRSSTHQVNSTQPKEWIETRLGRAGTLIAGSGFPHEYQDSKDGELAYYKVGNLAGETGNRDLGQSDHRISRQVARKLGARIVPPGAVVWAKIGAALSLNRRRTTSESCCIDNNMTALVPKPGLTTTAWMYYWMLALDFGPYANPGAVPSISEGAQARLPVLIPPLQEQRRIAAFLDHETARIDELVREQERLLNLLEARETARITDVVTRGLNDGVGLKESGHQALGGIPAHWEVVRLKHLLRAPLTYGANEAAVEDDPTLPRYIRITDIDGQGNLRDETFRSLPWEAAAPYLLEDGDLLLARSGATVGKSFLYRDRVGPACFAGYMIRARFYPSKLLPEYAEAYMKSRPYWDYIQESNIQATIQNVNAEKYGNCPVPVPPLEEQMAILRKLADESKSSRQLHVQASRSINYLIERRSALISAAVTGQLDLRSWELSAPETVAEVA